MTQTFPTKLNAYLTIALCITGIILPIIILGIIRSFRKGRQLKSPQFVSKYGTILEGIRSFKKKKLTITQNIALYWNAITIARWGISIAIFVFLKDLASLQVILLLSISLLFTLLIAFIQPFSIDDQRGQGASFVMNENYFKLLNEIFVTYYLIVLLMLTDITTDIELRAIFGMIELGIVVTCVLTNILKGGLAATNQYLIRKRKQKMTEAQRLAMIQNEKRKLEQAQNQAMWRQEVDMDLSMPYNLGDQPESTFIRVRTKPNSAQFTMKEITTNISQLQQSDGYAYRFEGDDSMHSDLTQVIRKTGHEELPFKEQGRALYFNR
ncbi:hypothetical protein FGO68_gene17738 [Halteria grandinella]|uniref:Uncharacterized protein n=1 Tax=Halteria grandinella TaxID=5974 RepID=A0A8J8TAA3_HALGN|nr:hypothetical protein FGO68_gene17738 [Halteria grandinella]